MAAKNHNTKGLKKAQGIYNPLTKRLFDLKEASVYLGRPVFSVRTLIWKGVLPCVKDGRKLYLDIHDMDAYIEINKERMV
ncbi:MAG TPA: helix-turn-helix domain-containing protein [Desulfatiglandales bacterium]|nr:helix-turn-helix domain-containing protein [Desulfatiglandales bacterium]